MWSMAEGREFQDFVYFIVIIIIIIISSSSSSSSSSSISIMGLVAQLV